MPFPHIQPFRPSRTPKASSNTPLEETDPRVAALLEWILSKQGQEIIERTGYVSLN